MSVSWTFPSHLFSNNALEELASPPPPKWLVNYGLYVNVNTLNGKAEGKQYLKCRGFVQIIKQHTRRENITQQLTVKKTQNTVVFSK